jgi:3-isopropylmalate/(R)-2-methylmalate dehydratase large subunit
MGESRDTEVPAGPVECLASAGEDATRNMTASIGEEGYEMGMTIGEKILAMHAGRESVTPGEFVLARVDLSLANDITAPVAIRAFQEAGGTRVRDPNRIALVMDHFTPNKDIASAEQVRVSRMFAMEQGLPFYFESEGIAHALLPEMGLVFPGQLVIGADSHTCTYGALGAFATGVGSSDVAGAWITGKVWLRVPESIKVVCEGQIGRWVTAKDLILWVIADLGTAGASYRVMEFCGDAVRSLSMDGRFTLANMAVEAGAKAGIVEVDDVTLSFSGEALPEGFSIAASDPDARYEEVRRYDVSRVEPLVALPPSPANVRRVQDIDAIPVDQVVIGSCTNGRLEDLRLAAQVLRGRKVFPGTRLIVIPATRRVYLEALRLGILHDLAEAGAVVCPPSCGPCLGGHLGVLASGERCLSTTNRNFVGRMGHPSSEVYLSGPAVAAASAVAGRIVHPDDVA